MIEWVWKIGRMAFESETVPKDWKDTVMVFPYMHNRDKSEKKITESMIGDEQKNFRPDKRCGSRVCLKQLLETLRE